MMKRKMSSRSLIALKKENLQKRKLQIPMPKRQPQLPRPQQQLEKMMLPLLKCKELPPTTLPRKRSKNRKVMNMIASMMKKEGTSGEKKAKTGISTTRKIRNRMKGVSQLYPKY